MVRINKVYTRTGDRGNTTLAGGQKVVKSSPRIEAFGGVDELNATLAVVAEYLKGNQTFMALHKAILRIQNELFDLGSQLAVLKEDRRDNTPVINAEDITRLEGEIDEMNAGLPDLKSFVLPGGGMTSAQLHVARTVCRRVERETTRLAAEESLDGTELPYLNRLSDWLFVASRFVAAKSGMDENLWQPGKR